MFDPIEIHGEGEYAENYTRVFWDEEEKAVGVDYIDTVTGGRDGREQFFGVEELEDLGCAFIRVADLVRDAQYAAERKASQERREAEKTRVAAMAAEEEKRKEALRARVFDWSPKSADGIGRIPRGF